MASKHILLIDGNSIMHANHNATPLSVGGMQVQAIFGVLRSLRALMQETPGQKELLCLWDGKAQFRMELFPEYKGNRAPMDAAQQASKDAFKRQGPFLEKALSMLNVRQMRSPLLEADDLAGHLIPRLVAAGYQITMVSGDRDWLQMVGPGVSWYDPIRNRRVDELNFLEFTGYFTTRAFLHGKALQGDGSDNIDGIAGLGEKGAALFLAQWKDVNEFFAAVDAGTHTPKARASKTATSLHPEQILASPEGRAVFERNVKLMDWSLSRKPAPGEIISTPASADVAGFELLCQRLAFRSILSEFVLFLRAFNIIHTKEIA
jgi:5'-3' exonuclease